jgi:hypothetical protein
MKDVRDYQFQYYNDNYLDLMYLRDKVTLCQAQEFENQPPVMR